MARPIPRARRDAYLKRVAALLGGRSFSNADLRRVAAVAQHEVLGITEPGSWWECRAGPKGATPKGRPLARSGQRPLPDLPPSGNNRS